MIVKSLEIRDEGTFMPVIAIMPIPDNEAQRYLLKRDGYRGDRTECCVILIAPQCRGVSYDPYGWKGCRTMTTAHAYIAQNFHNLQDGDVVDVQFIVGETATPKQSESLSEFWKVRNSHQ